MQRRNYGVMGGRKAGLKIWWVSGGLGAADLRVETRATDKKEEFPGLMENMLPGNSFPQICVVSVNKSVGNTDLIVIKTDQF